MNLHIARRKFADLLAAAAARCAQRITIANDHNFGDGFAARRNKGGNCRWFSAPALRVSGVFNVAACKHQAALIAHGRTHIKF